MENLSFTKLDREEIETAINWEVNSLIEGCKTNVGEHERTTVHEQNSAAIEQIWQAESAMAECSEYGQAVV